MSCHQEPPARPLLDGEIWKTEAIEHILPSWTKYAMDSAKGSFYSTLDANWKPVGDPIKFPSMIARHLFSYSAAYLLTGEEVYFDIATDIRNYLIAHAWDNQYGGWFDALDREGNVLQPGKSTFVQVYVITGLAMYYFITHDAEVRSYIDRSNDMLEGKVWDRTKGGYFDNVDRDWTVKTEVKSFASQLAPVSGYLLYMYMATMDEKYLHQAERICDAVLRHMIDPVSGWVLESFDKDWKYLPGAQDHTEINVGHNIETAWCLARLYRLNKRDDYLKLANTLSDSLHRYGFNPGNGFWYATIGNEDPTTHSGFTYWWIQAYGNMFDLFLAGLSPDKQQYEEHFVKGATFWKQYFLDRDKGDTHFSVLEDGQVKDSLKANQYKSSYHSIEHGLLNYLYLAAWVNPEKLKLFFKITSVEQGEILYPLPIENPDVRLQQVTINGLEFAFDPGRHSVKLPALKSATVSVTVF